MPWTLLSFCFTLLFSCSYFSVIFVLFFSNYPSVNFCNVHDIHANSYLLLIAVVHFLNRKWDMQHFIHYSRKIYLWNIFFKDFLLFKWYVSVCLCVGIFICIQCLQRPEVLDDPTLDRGARGCELLGMGAGSQTQGLWKISMCS